MGIPDPPMECGKAGRSWLWGELLNCSSVRILAHAHVRVFWQRSRGNERFRAGCECRAADREQTSCFQRVRATGRAAGQVRSSNKKTIATKRLDLVPILLDEKSPNGMEMWLVSYSFFYFLSNWIKLSTNTETAMLSRCDFHTESLNAWLELGIVTHHWVILTGLETRWEVMEVVSVWRRILGSGLVYPNRRRVSSWHWMSATSAFKVEAF